MIMKITHPFSGPSVKNVFIVLLPCLKSIALKKMENENVGGFRTQNKILEEELQRSNTLGSQMSSVYGGC